MVASKQLDFGLKPRVRDLLLKKHRHLHERRKSTQKKKSSLRGSKKGHGDKGEETQSGNKMYVNAHALVKCVLLQDDKNQHVGKTEVETPVEDMEYIEFPHVPTASFLIAQKFAAEDVTNDSDPELAKVCVRFSLSWLLAFRYASYRNVYVAVSRILISLCFILYC